MVYLVSGTDITERMLHARKLEHMAYHDSLLDIPNRQAALRNLQHMLREGKRCAVVLFDISDFKLFNETFGHAKGDLLLKADGEALTKSADLLRIRRRHDAGDSLALTYERNGKRSTVNVILRESTS